MPQRFQLQGLSCPAKFETGDLYSLFAEQILKVLLRHNVSVVVVCLFCLIKL